jgi:hypothetical protein
LKRPAISLSKGKTIGNEPIDSLIRLRKFIRINKGKLGKLTRLRTGAAAAETLGLSPLYCGREVTTVVAIFRRQGKLISQASLNLSDSRSWSFIIFRISWVQKYYNLLNNKWSATATWAICGFRMRALDTLRYFLLTWHRAIGLIQFG